MEQRNGNKCIRCGRELPEGIRYCLDCGASQITRPGASTAVSRKAHPALITAAILVLAAGFVFGAAHLARRTVGEPTKDIAPQTESATGEREKKAPATGVTAFETNGRPPATTTAPPATTAPPVTTTAPLSGDRITHQGITVSLANDWNSEVSNYFMCEGTGGFQDFRIISGVLYLSGDTLRLKGKATAAALAMSADLVDAKVFFEGESNRVGTTPLTVRTVSVIPANTGAGVTVDYDVAVASWPDLAATGKTAFELQLADHL